MKRFLSLVAAAAMIVGLCAFGGCSNNLPKPETAKQGVAYAYSAYGIAGTGVAAYIKSPACTKPLTTLPCSNPDLVPRLKAADAKAYDAIVAADTTVYSPGWDGTKADQLLAAAKQALLYLTAITAESAFTNTAPESAKDVSKRATEHIDKITAR